MHLTDRKLHIFQMAATLGNFTEAAGALGMTQPNVTQQIAQLERELGSPLFERDGKRLHLTPAGIALHRECVQLFADENRLLDRVRSAAAGLRCGRIGGTMTAGGYVLPGWLAAYVRQHPHTRLSLQVANTDAIAGLLQTRQLDVALVEGPFDRKRFLHQEGIADELLAVGASEALTEPVSYQEYRARGGRFILREKGSGTRDAFDQFLLRHDLPPPDVRNLIEVNNFPAILRLAASGVGVTVISELAAGEEIGAGRLRAAPFAEGRISRRMHFVYLPGDSLHFAEEFIAFCRRESRTGPKTGRLQFRG